MNPGDPVELKITTTRATRGFLVALADGGLYPATIEQVADELLRAKVREVVADGHHELGENAPRRRRR